MVMQAVAVHSGGMKGRGRKYPYLAISLFKARVASDGRVLWTKDRQLAETTTNRKAEEVARGAAEEHKASLLFLLGSLHNREVLTLPDGRFMPNIHDLARAVGLRTSTPLQLIHDAYVDRGDEATAGILARLMD